MCSDGALRYSRNAVGQGINARKPLRARKALSFEIPGRDFRRAFCNDRDKKSERPTKQRATTGPMLIGILFGASRSIPDLRPKHGRPAKIVPPFYVQSTNRDCATSAGVRLPIHAFVAFFILISNSLFFSFQFNFFHLNLHRKMRKNVAKKMFIASIVIKMDAEI